MMRDAIASFRFAPVLPLWLLVLLALLCCAVAALGFWRGARGAALRAGAFAVLLLFLGGPTLVRETRQGLSDIALLAIDHSASMRIGARLAQADRTARDIAAQAAKMPGLELRTVTLEDGGHDGTRLWTAIRQALGDIPQARLAGIIAVTDGQIHDLPDTAPAVPLHGLITAEAEEWDRRVRVIEAPSYGIVGKSLDLRVVVEDLGRAPQSGLAHLTVQRDGAPPQTQDVPVGEVQTLHVDIARAGPSLLKISTDAVPGEASPLNNQAVVQINGVRDRLRVLLVSGEPNQGERTWRRLLKSDPSVDLVHFTILRPPEKDDTTPLNELALIAFPTRELFQEKLSGFDLIILDRFTDRGILPHLYLQNIADYVRRGGGLLLTAGPEFASPESLDQTPLSSVLPAHAPIGADGVIEQKFVPIVTELGARHPVTEGLAGADPASPGWGPWYRAIAAEDTQGQVLMTGPDGTKLLILNRVEKGRAAMLMSDQIWLWSRGHGGGGPQAELLRRISHWLMQEPELDEERLTASLEGGKLVVERRSVDRAAAIVTVTPPSGPELKLPLQPAAPGLARGAVDVSLPGVWQVGDGTHLAFAVAGQDDRLEIADLRATAGMLRGVSQRSGGGIAWVAGRTPELRRVAADRNAAGPGWIGLRRREAHLVTGVSAIPLLPPWLALPLLLALVIAAWRREAA